jgi:hypothetical protein
VEMNKEDKERSTFQFIELDCNMLNSMLSEMLSTLK